MLVWHIGRVHTCGFLPLWLEHVVPQGHGNCLVGAQGRVEAVHIAEKVFCRWEVCKVQVLNSWLGNHCKLGIIEALELLGDLAGDFIEPLGLLVHDQTVSCIRIQAGTLVE